MPLELATRKAVLGVMTSMFSTVEDLRTFTKDYLGRNLDEIGVGALGTVRSRLVDRAEEREWLRELIEALKEVAGPDAKATLETIDVSGSFSNPKVAALRAAIPDVAERLGVPTTSTDAALDAALAARLLEVAKNVRSEAASVSPELRRAFEQLGLLAETPPSLEKIVRDSNSLLDIRNWVTRLTEIEAMVCRISLDTGGGLAPRGTGFLVAPDVVLTNHHVVSGVIDESYQPKQVRVQFDYHVLRDGSVDVGTIVKLHENWLIASAPHDPVDTEVHDLTKEPKPGNLDFALLRLARKVGAEAIGDRSDAGRKKKRGWIKLDEGTAPNAAAGAPVFIVQHPSGGPMKLALDTAGVIGYSPKQRRIRYRTNTLSGSSGSPVFDQNWDLLALHHAGDPKYPDLDTGKYNEGIPIRTLVKHFTEKDILAKL